MDCFVLRKFHPSVSKPTVVRNYGMCMGWWLISMTSCIIYIKSKIELTKRFGCRKTHFLKRGIIFQQDSFAKSSNPMWFRIARSLFIGKTESNSSSSIDLCNINKYTGMLRQVWDALLNSWGTVRFTWVPMELHWKQSALLSWMSRLVAGTSEELRPLRPALRPTRR